MFCPFLPVEDKAKARHRLYSFQRALAMKRAQRLQGISRWGHAVHVATMCRSLSPFMYFLIPRSRCKTHPPQWVDGCQQEKSEQTLAMPGLPSSSGAREIQNTRQSSEPRGKLVSVKRICLGNKRMEIRLSQSLVTFRSKCKNFSVDISLTT